MEFGHLKFANAAFISSVSTTGVTWIANLTPVLQLIATVVAIVAGIYAIRVYRKKLKDDE